jgi:putative transposase
VATVGAVPAETVQRYIETQYERAPKAGGRA